MNVTTPSVLRTTFIAAIRDIVPSHTDYAAERWRHVNRLREVPGRLRNFHVACGVAEDVDGGFHGGGLQQSFELAIWTYYGDLHPNEDDSIISEDRRQIWLTLRGLAESGTDGFITINPVGWEEEEDEEGRLFGAHVFEVHYLASDTA